jgi:hypothetical protein
VTEPGRRVGLTSQELTALQTTLFQLTVIVETFPCRAYNSGAIARYPSLASRRQISLMCSWTPKISWTTSTTGKAWPWAGLA